jgi:hypothetical protein
VLELAALAALGYWGSRTGDGVAINVVLAIAAPLAAAAVWGTFAAPRSAQRLRIGPRLVVELAVFAAAAGALAAAGQPTLAVVLAGLAAVVETLTLILGDEPGAALYS